MNEECSIGLNVANNSCSSSNLPWIGFADTYFNSYQLVNNNTPCTSNNTIVVGTTNYSSWANVMRSCKNLSNRLLMLYKGSSGWENGGYANSLVLVPNSTIPNFQDYSGWDRAVGNSNLNGGPCNADQFISVIGRCTDLNNTLCVTNFYQTLSTAQKVTLLQSINHNGCDNGYTANGGTGTLWDFVQLAACLSSYAAYNIITAGDPDIQAMTNLTIPANGWLTNYVTDSQAAQCILNFCGSGNNMNSAVAISIMTTNTAIAGSANGKALLSSLGTNYCNGNNLTQTICTDFCGSGNPACDTAVTNACGSSTFRANNPTLCGCLEPFEFDATIPVSIQDVMEANPQCCLPSCANAYKTQSMSQPCTINISSCVDTNNVTNSGSLTLTAVQSTACDQLLGTGSNSNGGTGSGGTGGTGSGGTGGTNTTPTGTTTTSTSTTITDLETWGIEYWIYLAVVGVFLLIFIIYLFSTIGVPSKTETQVLTNVNRLEQELQLQQQQERMPMIDMHD